MTQVGKTLADSLHQSAGGGLHRMAVSTADAGASPPPPHTTWHSHYNELALQLIASTTTAGSYRGIKNDCSCAELGHSIVHVWCSQQQPFRLSPQL
jgi:hypothetical protein